MLLWYLSSLLPMWIAGFMFGFARIWLRKTTFFNQIRISSKYMYPGAVVYVNSLCGGLAGSFMACTWPVTLPLIFYPKYHKKVADFHLQLAHNIKEALKAYSKQLRKEI